MANNAVKQLRQPSATLKKEWKEQITAYFFLLPAILVFTFSKYYPILQGFFASFFSVDIVDLPGDFVGLDNYIRAFTDKHFFEAFLNNLKFLGVGLVMNFWVPILIALLINEVRHKRVFFRTMYFLPAVVPGIATAVIWKYIWQPDYGLANYILSLFNLPPQMWLNDINLTYWCMAFPGLIMSGGMSMLIYLAAMQDISNEQYESAVIEGAGFWHRIRYIMLPQIKHIIGIMFILDVIAKFNEISTPLVMTGGGPAGGTETLILYAYKQALEYVDYGYSITMANIVFLIVFVITAFQMKLTNKED